MLHLALIYLNPGQRDARRWYENLALPVFRRHGGCFERIVSPVRAPGGPPTPTNPTRSTWCASRPRKGRTRSGGIRRWSRWLRSRKAPLLRVDDVPPERYFKPG